MEENLYRSTDTDWRKTEAAGVTHNPPLTSAEIAHLWDSYLRYTMIVCIARYFLQHVDDQDARWLLEDGLDICSTRVRIIADILSREARPIPRAFGDEDMDLKAPRLYTDTFYHYYFNGLSRIGLAINSMALTTSTRPDIRAFYHQCCISTMRYWDRSTDIMLAKGFPIRPPYLNTFDQVDFTRRQSFLTGFLGERRPFLAVEVQHIYFNILNNLIGKSLLIGLRQSARSELLRKYFSRGIEIADKHMDIFSSLLKQEDILAALPSFAFVTDSTVPPLSDRLLMFNLSSTGALGIGNYAASMAGSMRHDLSLSYARLIAEAANYTEDGVNIMIDNDWFEEPPRAVDQREIADKVRH